MSRTETLRAIAQRLADVEEGVACKGTALESIHFTTRGKAFLFIGAKEARLKLGESAAEAAQLAAQDPQHYRVGAHGWVTLSLAADPPRGLLERWIGESHGLYAAAPAAAGKRKRAAT